LAEYLRLVDRRTLISGATRPKITQADLLSVSVPVPVLDDQERVMKLVGTRKARDNAIINQLNLQIELAYERRAAVITAAVSGLADVTARRVA
jgi:type I restriction enzyme S subunit